MANRNIEAKKVKLRKAKRLFPKRYSSEYIPVGLPPNREVMSGYKERARGLAFDADYMNWLENQYQRFKCKTPGRVEVEAHIRRIEQHAPAKLFFKLMENSALRARCFFNSERTVWIIMEEDFKRGTIKSSMTYSSKDSIVYAWRKGKIKWVVFSKGNTSREVPAPPLLTS